MSDEMQNTPAIFQNSELPDFTNPVAAARAWADAMEAKRQAEVALIQKQTELAVVQEEAHAAKATLGFAGDYVQIKDLTWVPSLFNIRAKNFWSKLEKAFSAACRHIGMPWTEVPDPMYGKVRAYPFKLTDAMHGIYLKVQLMDDAEFKDSAFRSHLPGSIFSMRKYMKKRSR